MTPASVVARLVVRRRWIVIGSWALAGALATLRAPRVADELTARGAPPGATESAAADRLIESRFTHPLTDVLVVTLQAPAALDSGAGGQVLDSLTAAIGRRPYAERVLGWRATGDSTLVSRDHRVTALFVSLAMQRADTLDAVADLRAVVRSTLRRTGVDTMAVRARVTGEPALDADLRTVSEGDSRRGELRLAPLTLAVLVLAFGALAAATLPLVVGFLAIWISLALIALLATVTPMSVFVMNITTMLGLGVGIDYSLLVVTRFREELGRTDPLDAAVRAAETAGAAAFTSGLTVLVGFATLLLTPIVETRSLGIGGLIVVAVAVALATTLLPAMLAVLGARIDRPLWLSRILARYHARHVWAKWSRAIIARPVTALAGAGVVIALLVLPATRMRIGLPARDWWPSGTESADGAAMLDRLGLGAAGQPIHLVVEMPAGEPVVSRGALVGLQSLADSLAANPRVKSVRSVATPGATRDVGLLAMFYADLDAARARAPDLLDAYLSRDGRAALLDVVLRDTVSLVSGMDVVREARRLARTPPAELRGARILVTGFFASTLDLQDALMGRFPLVVALILGVTAVMLAVAFRSVLVPVKAVLMNLLSVLAAFGLIVWVFQDGHGSRLFSVDGATEAIFAVVPVLVFAITFGLSMDYEVFLLARVKEAFDRTGHNDDAIEEGLSASATTITSAALIMILVFGAFAFARVFVVQVLGFGLAVAVLLDATVIRMVIVPALMQLAGRWNWWPGTRRRPPGRSRVE